MMPDELLEELGNFFVRMHVYARKRITFQQFVEQYLAGGWGHVHTWTALEEVR